MKKFKTIALTDHTNHSKENSLYAILRQMADHPQCSQLDVASRGNINNALFFDDVSTTQLSVKSVDQSFNFDKKGLQFNLKTRSVDLLDYDIILLRLPRPISDHFLITLREIAQDKVIINDPLGIITCSSKSFLLHFPDLCPPIKLCRSIEEVIQFSKVHDLVLKPLKAYGGKGLLKITGAVLNDGQQDWETLPFLKTIEEELNTEGFLAMKYLKNVHEGDKRLIVVNGKILAASLRLPAKDSWLCNVAQGGTSIPSKPTHREQEIVKKINPLLTQHGILIYGVDTLVDDQGERILSEINTLSIGGFPQAEKQTGLPIIQMTLDQIFNYASL